LAGAAAWSSPHETMVSGTRPPSHAAAVNMQTIAENMARAQQLVSSDAAWPVPAMVVSSTARHRDCASASPRGDAPGNSRSTEAWPIPAPNPDAAELCLFHHRFDDAHVARAHRLPLMEAEVKTARRGRSKSGNNGGGEKNSSQLPPRSVTQRGPRCRDTHTWEIAHRRTAASGREMKKAGAMSPAVPSRL